MNAEMWLLVVVEHEEPDKPWAEAHPTYIQAMRSLFERFDEDLPDERSELGGEAAVHTALAHVIDFTIHTAIIDTDALEEAEIE